jgi:hypothetical protein
MSEEPSGSVVCSFCRHLISPGCPLRTCAAFPDGIPAEIWDGTNHHTEAVAGDHGLRFQWRGGKALKPPWME